MTDPYSSAVLTTGEMYTGNQQFKGMGISRWCCLCAKHKDQLGGSIRFVLGGRNWVCSKHPKVEK
jgi:hypothetical protein